MICSQQKDLSTYEISSSYTQNPNIAERRIDDTVFLVDPDTDIVFYLDSLGAGIWHLLKEPVSLRDATTIVQQAFPDMQAENISRDVARLINELSKRNLVLKDA